VNDRAGRATIDINNTTFDNLSTGLTINRGSTDAYQDSMTFTNISGPEISALAGALGSLDTANTISTDGYIQTSGVVAGGSVAFWDAGLAYVVPNTSSGWPDHVPTKRRNPVGCRRRVCPLNPPRVRALQLRR